ncbi:hypothetical protein S4A8_01675 [Salinisphaera sp. S4-8]|uniref:DUF1272 domain-containing protein n=1 Tax=Salinisphaera sp. S4-8 TaxID=633357 RepID=UPI00334103AC
MLKMKPTCETCGATTKATDVAYICSFECTFCESCTTRYESVCPNCAGELLRRPTRRRTPLEVASS